MRLLAVSDLHGNLENVFLAVNMTHPDLVLSCGDWGNPGSVSVEEFESLLHVTSVYTVYGNHDDIGLLASLVNTDGSPVLMNSGAVYDIAGVSVAAINGIWAKSHDKPFYVTDEEASEYGRLLSRQHPDILVSHACAIGLADEVPGGRHAGQRSWLDAYEAISPRLYLCGHLHMAQKRVLKNEHIVVNVGSTADGDFWIFEVGEKDVRYEYHKIGSVEQPDSDE